jgi:multicomponent Na+:H+ antiporter subunit D
MSPGHLAAAPVVLPLAAALGALLAGGRPRLSRALALLGAASQLAAAVMLLSIVSGGTVLATDLGAWPHPFAIRFSVDRLSAVFLLLSGGLGLAVLASHRSGAGNHRDHPLLLGLLAGSGGAFATADLFNLYVWLELLLICALGLLVRSGGRDGLAAAFRYLALNLFGTLVLLLGVALVYGRTGHLAFSAIAEVLRSLPAREAAALPLLLLAGLLVKAGAFPVFQWLPAAYPSLPPAVAALFSGLVGKVGIYAILRLGSGVFAPLAAEAAEVLGWIAVLTMVAGVAGAGWHFDLRRILAWHSMSQIGYVLLGIATGTPEGLAAALVFTFHHALVKADLFLVVAATESAAGSSDLRRLGGLATSRPALATLLALPALSLVGVPPFFGFWAKLSVLGAGFGAGRGAWTAAALLVSLFTLYSMAKVWMEACWRPRPAGAEEHRGRIGVVAGLVLVILTAATFGLGLWPEPVLRFAAEAVETLR